MRKSFIAAAAATLSVAGLASAQVLIDEDFESYADTADLGSTWSLGDGTLDTAFGNPGQSLNHPGTGGSFTGANTNSLGFTPTLPTVANPLIVSGMIYDDANSTNERNTIGVRAAAGANIIEMGHYNNPAHYAIRTVLFDAGSDGDWVAFDLTGAPDANPLDPTFAVEGWHTYNAVITDTTTTFTLDLLSNGSIDATIVANTIPQAAFPLDQLRLGGPSDLGSVNGGVNFDNLLVEIGGGVIPEPASLGLLSVAGLGLMRRRK